MLCESYFKFFETVSHRTRWKILEALGDGPMCVTEISKALDEEQSKISHNLKNLSECNFLEVKKKGKERIYSLNKETIVPLMNLVEKHVQKHCEGSCGRRK